MPERPGERGFALLLVLWAVVLLSLLGTQFLANAGLEARLAANIRISAELEASADAGLHDAMARMMDGRWRAGGGWRPLQSRHGQMEVLLENLDGRINPNTAMVDLLSALFRQVGVHGAEAFEIATKVREWRTPARGLRTAAVKAREYQLAGRTYGPPGTPFQTLEELRGVLGMTPELFARIKPHLSLHTQDDPDPAVASPIVRQAMTEAAGPRGYDSPGHGRDHTVLVQVAVSGQGGTRFVRRAVVLVNLKGERPWRVVAVLDEQPSASDVPVAAAARPGWMSAADVP